MTKNTTLCFRTALELKETLKQNADRKAMTLSAFIEHILYEYLEHQEECDGTEKERRQHLRRQTRIPVAVKAKDGRTMKSYAGTIENISLGGVGIAVPDTFTNKVRDASQGTEMEIFFSLPGEEEYIRMHCSLARVLMLNGQEIHLGAAFQNVTPSIFDTLQSFLDNKNTS